MQSMTNKLISLVLLGLISGCTQNTGKNYYPMSLYTSSRNVQTGYHSDQPGSVSNGNIGSASAEHGSSRR